MKASAPSAAGAVLDPASSAVTDVAELLTRRITALDLACGEGRNALYLAGRGIEVTALDPSPLRVQRLEREAAARGVPLAARVQSLAHFRFSRRFDLLLACGCLESLAPDARERLVTGMQAHTRARGFNVVEVVVGATPAPSTHHPPLADGEIFDLYAGWRILVRQSFGTQALDHGSPGAWIGTNRLVAQKI